MQTGECQSQRVSRENVTRGGSVSLKLILRFFCFCFAGPVNHVLWAEEEKKAVFKHLSTFIRQGRCPGKLDCENCILNTKGTLDGRDWRAVKYYVKNQVDKRKRVLAPKNS